MFYVSVHVLYSGYFMNNGGGDAVAPGRGFVVAVQNQNIVPRLGVFLYMGGFAFYYIATMLVMQQMYY